jgi:putative ABC transport system ATP-binding protein
MVGTDMAEDKDKAPPDTAALLRIERLRFRWARANADCLAVDALELQPREAVFLRGPSGCGKSTLLSLIAGVLKADGGTLRLLGHDLGAASATWRDRLRADHIGYVFQQFNLLPYLSVLDNVLLPCRFSARRMTQAGGAAQASRSAEALLSAMGLDAAFWKRPATELSVGQQQRVAAARALMGKPELVIADEPTSALDEDLRVSFMQVLLQACADAGSTLLFVSHDARLAPMFARQLDLPLLNSASVIATGEAA